jgi:hypothetical protein
LRQLRFALSALDLQQEIGEPPDFPQVRVLYPAHQQSVGMARSVSLVAGRLPPNPVFGALFYPHDNTPLDMERDGDQRLGG